MDYTRICAVYFSATGCTKTQVSVLAERLATHCSLPIEHMDFTLPQGREKPMAFQKTDIVVIGTPVYAGRVPNLLLPTLNAMEGNGALVIPMVSYGNRSADDALVELRNITKERGFYPVGAASFVGEHSFSHNMASGRPDASDRTIAKGFADQIWHKIEKITDVSAIEPFWIRGNNPPAPYFRPTDGEGNFIDIRRVKPKTHENICDKCGVCAKHCPMGSIPQDDLTTCTGICIKCNACVRLCHTGAKYFDDPNYLFHMKDIVSRYSSPRKEGELFL